MSCHRIKKYSRQIVCQDMVLSCQPDHIEEIPLFKRAGVTAVSLRNQRVGSGGEGSSWLERDSDLSGMLVNWHLWSSKSVPFPNAPSRIERTRRTSTEKRNKMCNSSLTLRNQLLYMSMEKYLLFLMPREMTNKRVVYMLPESCSRQDRFRFSALYVDTALGLRQYQLRDALSEKVVSDDKGFRSIFSSALSPEKVCFPSLAISDKALLSDPKKSWLYVAKHSLAKTVGMQSFALRCTTIGCASVRKAMPYTGRYTGSSRPRRSLRPTLSLHCPSVLGAPDIQDIAQSGLMTLEGSLTLELS